MLMLTRRAHKKRKIIGSGAPSNLNAWNCQYSIHLQHQLRDHSQLKETRKEEHCPLNKPTSLPIATTKKPKANRWTRPSLMLLRKTALSTLTCRSASMRSIQGKIDGLLRSSWRTRELESNPKLCNTRQILAREQSSRQWTEETPTMNTERLMTDSKKPASRP